MHDVPDTFCTSMDGAAPTTAAAPHNATMTGSTLRNHG
jgi:hypothetical protein